jgi:hypothetical protein
MVAAAFADARVPQVVPALMPVCSYFLEVRPLTVLIVWFCVVVVICVGTLGSEILSLTVAARKAAEQVHTCRRWRTPLLLLHAVCLRHACADAQLHPHSSVFTQYR